ncbi:MAG: isoleucine--tRNA ligase [Leptospirales bacterium]
MSDESGKSKKEKNPWSQSIHLPQTEFPMRAQLPMREPGIIEFWENNKIYNRILDKRKAENAKPFILHDGPPYANGNFHVGHALNKILKDMINKYHLLQGKYVPYVPGWDCHGLPIELAALKKLANRKKGEDKDPQKVRAACRKYAAEFIQIQANDQSRFGVLWDNTGIEDTAKPEQTGHKNFYYTMSADYESNILRAFRNLFEKGYIYKGKKPVYWDTKAQTAMAEAEVEYENHTSPSIYVKFPVKNKEAFSDRKLSPEGVVIWTTTPWTIPANLALCFHPDLPYSVYKTDKGNLVIADGLEESFFEVTGISFSDKESITKAEIETIEASHPFINRNSKIVFGNHVTLEAGTGVVHTAPGHGQDDYRTGLEYDLEPYSPVDHRGRYTSEFPEMEGDYVFDANPKIVELLKEKEALLGYAEIEHSYPHSWRSHSPLIFRATPQWFLGVEDLRKKAMEEAGKVKWIPSWGQNRFESMLENRPDWCLSRQRAWGVPIPSFACEKCGATHMDLQSLDHIVAIVEKEGIEVWFEREASQLLPQGAKCGECGGETFAKENDILDVWFDSGVSWYSVLQQNENLSFPADLYLEGSDQHRGWFQSSLWPSLALNDTPPYKTVLTHGYVLDSNGKAMSKSKGNVISPVKDIIPKYGADILRLWVSSEDYKTDNRISLDMMDLLSDSYRKIRNTFRYMLGNLNDLKEVKTSPENITEEIDHWILHELALLEEKIINAFENSEFHQVYHRILSFCTISLSNTYFDIVRDRLYCDGTPENRDKDHSNKQKRESSLATLQVILDRLVVWIAPVLSFTSEEIYQLLHPGNSVFEVVWPSASPWKNPELGARFEPVWKVKDEVNGVLEQSRTSGEIRSSLEARVSIPKTTAEALKMTNDELAFYLVVSEVETGADTISAVKSNLEKCPRCWVFKKLEKDGLCPRCSEVVS